MTGLHIEGYGHSLADLMLRIAGRPRGEARAVLGVDIEEMVFTKLLDQRDAAGYWACRVHGNVVGPDAHSDGFAGLKIVRIQRER